MKRTTIFVDEALEHDLKAIAGRRRQAVATVVREALAEYVMSDKRVHRTSLGFVAAGASGYTDTADHHEDILWRGSASGAEPKDAGSQARPAPQNSGKGADRHKRRSR